MTEDFFELVGSTLHDKYRVDAAIGEGGFGVVYRGSHLRLEQPVAIKCLKIPRHFTAKAKELLLERFQAEGKHLAKLSQHPSITRVYDFAVASGAAGEPIPYLVLEWLEGRDLHDEIYARAASGTSFDEHSALGLLRDAIDALAFAHEQGIAHRDIKPPNLFVAAGPRGKPAVKLLDFGIAKLMLDGERTTRSATKTSSGFSAFSPGYGSPEQFRSETYGESGPWTDVHAMGLVLVEMVSGRPALDGANGVELYLACMRPERPTPRRAGVEVSDAFEALVEKALAIDPKDRFESATELLEAADAIITAAPVPTPPARAEISVGDAPVDVGAVTALPEAPIEPPPITDRIPPPPPEPPPPPPALPLERKPSPVPPKRSPPAQERRPAPAPPSPTLIESPRPRSSGYKLWGPVALLAILVGLAAAGVNRIGAETTTSSASANERGRKRPKPKTGAAPSRSQPTVSPTQNPFARCEDLPACEQACRGGSAADCELMMRSVTGGKEPDANVLLRMSLAACDQNNASGCVHAGVLLFLGRRSKNPKHALEREPARGQALLEKSCEMGGDTGCSRAGRAHWGAFAEKRDAAKAEYYFRKGCVEQKDPSCCKQAKELHMSQRNELADPEKVKFYEDLEIRHGCAAGRPTYCAKLEARDAP